MEVISEDIAMEVAIVDDASTQALSESCMMRGIIFSKSVRSAFCSLHVALLPEADKGIGFDSEDDDVSMVRIQFPPDVAVSFRSHCRRFYKLGDLVSFANGSWNDEATAIISDSDWRSQKLILEPSCMQDLEVMIRIEQVRHWTMKQCQQLQQQFCQHMDSWTPDVNDARKDRIVSASKPPIWMDHPAISENDGTRANAHGSGLAKRVQKEYIAQFLVHMIMDKLNATENPHGSSSFLNLCDPSSWATTDPRVTDLQLYQKAVDYLNTGTGVIDAAGGSGHVSMHLGLLGVRSTVIDAREAVGKLPGKDRKIWKQALKQSRAVADDTLYCQPIVEYDARRGWLGPLLQGTDTDYRHPDEPSLAVYESNHDFVVHCSAMVALHPDEATDAIVSMAVMANKPLVVVPCCVFARIFHTRFKPGTTEPVSTRPELLDYLKAKHTSIRQSTLPFKGANSILWSAF